MDSDSREEVSPLLHRKREVDVEQSGGSCCGCCPGCARIRQSRNTAIIIMFLAFMLDLMLLTVVGKSDAKCHIDVIIGSSSSYK